jgi:hypothetical protein
LVNTEAEIEHAAAEIADVVESRVPAPRRRPFGSDGLPRGRG